MSQKSGIASLVMVLIIGSVITILTLAILGQERNDDTTLLHHQLSEQANTTLESCERVARDMLKTNKQLPEIITIAEGQFCTVVKEKEVVSLIVKNSQQTIEKQIRY